MEFISHLNELSKKKIDIHADSDYSFRIAITNKNFELLEYLIKYDKEI